MRSCPIELMGCTASNGVVGESNTQSLPVEYHNVPAGTPGNCGTEPCPGHVGPKLKSQTSMSASDPLLSFMNRYCSQPRQDCGFCACAHAAGVENGSTLICSAYAPVTL